MNKDIRAYVEEVNRSRTPQDIQEMKRQIYKMNRGSDELQIGFSNGTLKVIAFEKLFEFINSRSKFTIGWSESENDKVISQLEKELWTMALSPLR